MLSQPHTIRILGWSRRKKVLAVHGDHLKHRFLDLTQVAFWAGQEAEN